MPAAEVQSVGQEVRRQQEPLLDEARQLHRLPADRTRLASLFKGNLNLRQAINYAIDRKDYVSQAGPFAGQPWTHIFNPGVPGWTNVYDVQAERDQGEEAGQGSLQERQDQRRLPAYAARRTPRSPQIVQRDLISLGFKPGNINMKPFSGADLYDAMGQAQSDLDMGTRMGWCSDYPDPYDWINVLLYGGASRRRTTTTTPTSTIPKWNKKMQ